MALALLGDAGQLPAACLLWTKSLKAFLFFFSPLEYTAHTDALLQQPGTKHTVLVSKEFSFGFTTIRLKGAETSPGQ